MKRLVVSYLRIETTTEYETSLQTLSTVKFGAAIVY